MPVYRFETLLGPCEIRYEANVLTGFRLPGLGAEERVANEPAPDWVERLSVRVQAHLRGELQDFAELPYAWQRVSTFQRDVYQAALRVKAGQTSTYGALAAAVGQPPAVSRAVGTALGQNPWPLLVPCHRFLGAGGKMTGFSAPGGIKTKLRLLAIEGSELLAEG
jgi:methylated-DNA-[protein]-cysteine S-methyltransferase